MPRPRCNDRAIADKRCATRAALEQAAERNRARDVEISRYFSAAMFDIADDTDRFDRAERIQAECDRLLTLSDQEAGHAAAS